MIVSYRRVSTDRQDIGLDAQEAAISNWIVAQGRANDARLFMPDLDFVEKQSGKNMKRPELQKAIAAAESSKGTLVTAKLDRLSRSVSDFAALVERANRSGWQIVVCDLNIDMTTPSGLLIANIMASLAQWERSMIALRIKEALRQKRKQGIYPGRPVPEHLVELIRYRRGEGMTLREIASHLNTSGAPTAAGGKMWYASTVRGVLGRAS